VVAAAKEFSLAQNGTRAIEAGMVYQPPPAVARPALAGDADPAQFEDDTLMRSPVLVYRREGVIEAAYVVPLERFVQSDVEQNGSLLDVLRTYRETRNGTGERRQTAQRRHALAKRLSDRERKVRDELASLEAKRQRAQTRESLREAGDAIYATLYELNPAARDEAKDHAAKLFAEYKKLGATIPHLDEREGHLRALQQAIEELKWETERAADTDIDDVESAVALLEPRPNHPVPNVRKRKRAPLEYRTESGSRILVGRSPSENADLTFRVARPNDLWFHAQNIPGAHVILARDDRSEPPSEDIARAATLAASFSKGKASGKIAIDYTFRKHVRAQRNAPPGLVWYTNARTILAEPQTQ
jgi:predicted ribosome quality control (RQC) complex YloA/Tae2 family protein